MNKHSLEACLSRKVGGKHGLRFTYRRRTIGRNELRLAPGGSELAGKIAPAVLVSGVQEQALRRQPRFGQSDKRADIAIGRYHIREPCIARRLSRARTDAEDGNIAAAFHSREGAHAIGAGEGEGV